jgi:hypothetical protein
LSHGAKSSPGAGDKVGPGKAMVCGCRKRVFAQAKPATRRPDRRLAGGERDGPALPRRGTEYSIPDFTDISEIGN